ncbi:MAG: global cell cycle regulator GcrA-like protein [Inquilinus sp.]|nr:global cell cycle regulator GcrA-like protein [Inquilinus sp.]
MSWTDEKVAVLRRYWGSGKSASEIAEIIGGLSRNAVIGKAHRLGLAGRPSPIKERKKPAARSEQPVAAPPPAVVAAVERVPVDGATILALTERMCRWPHGDPKKPGFQFCGKPVAAGLSYCAAHMKLAYQPPAARRRDSERRIAHG